MSKSAAQLARLAGPRVLLALVCLAAWGWLTHLGASRFRRATAPCPGDPR